MMTVKCPKCATLLKFQPQASTVRITCPKCATLMQVAAQAPQPAAAPRPNPTRAGSSHPKTAGKPGTTGRPKTAGKPETAGKPNITGRPAKKHPATAPLSSAPRKVAPTMPAADPLAAPAGFDLGNLNLPEPDGVGSGGFGFADPLASPAVAGMPVFHPNPAMAKPAVAPKPATPATASSAKLGDKKLLWVGLASAGLVTLLTVGGLAFFLMDGSGSTVAQQTDSPAAEESAPAIVHNDSPDVAVAAVSEPDALKPDASSDGAASTQADSASPVADSSQDSASSVDHSVAAVAVPADFTAYSSGVVSASFPGGKPLVALPTGIQGQAIRSEATKSTLYVAVGKIDPAITDQEKIAEQVERLVMADIYPGQPCQRSSRQGFQGRLSSGLVLPNMELEIYKIDGEVIVIGWAQPQHELDLWTPLILQDRQPPVKVDKAAVEAEKSAFLGSVKISAPGST